MNPDALLQRGLIEAFNRLKTAHTDEEIYVIMNVIWSAGYQAALVDCGDEAIALED